MLSISKISLSILALLGSVLFESNAQSSQNIDSLISFELSRPRYVIGVHPSLRLTSPSEVLGINATQQFRRTEGIDLSIIRFSHPRLFWSAGIGLSYANESYPNIIDTRWVYDEVTDEYELQDLGSKDEVHTYQCITLPISTNHLLLNRAGSNIYISGGVTLDWLYRFKIERNAEYDGISETIYKMGKFQRISATVHGGFGWYQPLGENFLLRLGPSFGYTFLTENETELQNRSSHETFMVDLEIYYRLGRQTR